MTADPCSVAAAHGDKWAMERGHQCLRRQPGCRGLWAHGFRTDTRSDALFIHQNRRDYNTEMARAALERGELVADTDAATLKAGLLELYRKAASDLKEGGANTLYLAVGSLRWRPVEKTDAPYYRAPILLVPVTLQRGNAAEPPKLVRHDDETVCNLTLLEMLRGDFDLHIPELSGTLPTDQSGADVEVVMRIMRKAIGEARGWSVEDEVMLSTFNFAKYLMWKDLSDRTDQLKQSRFVTHMIERPHERYKHGATMVNASELDEKVHPRELLTPLPGDSSQLVAVHASGGDGDMVLEGPPGTGKSQTIANIIAHNIGIGRRVLFVAEKMTALSVVHDRLTENGLGDFCLELHSSKASRRAMVEQLDKAWRLRETYSRPDWAAKADKLKQHRDALNGLVQALHEKAHSGISPRQAIAEACASPLDISVQLNWPRGLENDPIRTTEQHDDFMEQAKLLGEAFGELSADERAAFADIEHSDWSYDWSTTLADAADRLTTQLNDVTRQATRFAGATGLPVDTDSEARLEALAGLAAVLAETLPAGAAVYLASNGEQVATRLESALEDLSKYRVAYEKLSAPVAHSLVESVDHAALDVEWASAMARLWPIRWFACRTVRAKAAAIWQVDPVEDVGREARMLAGLRVQAKQVRTHDAGLSADAGWQGVDTADDRARALVAAGRRLRQYAMCVSGDGDAAAAVRETLARLLRTEHERFAQGMQDTKLACQFADAWRSCAEALERFRELARINVDREQSLGALRGLAQAILDRQPRLKAWCQWQLSKRAAEARGLHAFVRGLEVGAIAAEGTAAAFRVAYCRWLAPQLIDRRPELCRFSGKQHERLITEFRKLDDELAKAAAAEIRARLSQEVPRRDAINHTKGYGQLLREVQAKRSPKTVRDLMATMAPAIEQLTPCLLMSPMSVAQYIPVDANPYDLVIFDEASQITTWDAIGAIARGRNVIIVGDPKQMPPTNFFNRSADDDDATRQGDSEEVISDLESILDEALATGMRHHRLTGHYRSRHESLITFSNHNYYHGELVTYPACATLESAVSLVRVNGAYQKGSARTNPEEAKAVVAEISARLRDPARRHQRIGVVTMNSEQQRLIRDLLDDERRKHPQIEPAFKGPDREEQDMVYNLETVQGHERDVIMLSIGYGPTSPGDTTMAMNFGPLNREGGERRLNVAITRATQEVVVFASFGPEMIDLSRTRARAVEDLKLYMEFAAQGPKALRRATRYSIEDTYESPFEEAVAVSLRRKGWTVRTQVGVSRFRVDLGVVHPDLPGRFLAGIECDGASYHSSPTARDRDRIRQSVLETLGWKLLRLWSTDFFLEPTAAIERLHARLTEVLTQERALVAQAGQAFTVEDSPVPVGITREANARASEASTSETVVPESSRPWPEVTELSGTQAVTIPPVLQVPQPLPINVAPSLVPAAPPSARAEDREALDVDLFGACRESREDVCRDASDGTGDEDESDGGPLNSPALQQFYDDAYLPTLRSKCLAIIDREGPMHMGHLAERIAREHGFLRTGKLIRKQVLNAVGRSRVLTDAPDREQIVWPASMKPADLLTYRGDRPWDDTPYPERLWLAIQAVEEHGCDNALEGLRTALSISRLREKRRLELEALIEAAVKHRRERE